MDRQGRGYGRLIKLHKSGDKSMKIISLYKIHERISYKIDKFTAPNVTISLVYAVSTSYYQPPTIYWSHLSLF